MPSPAFGGTGTEQCEIRTGLPRGRPKGSLSGEIAVPPCPRCGSFLTRRAGMARGAQRAKCRGCRRSFYANLKIVHQPLPRSFDLICYRCDSKETTLVGRSQRGGLIGWCKPCGKKFQQGGLLNLKLNYYLLLRRIRELNVPDRAYAEVLQTAALDILDGKGYAATVELDVRGALRRSDGPQWGPEGRGSDHFAVGGHGSYDQRCG